MDVRLLRSGELERVSRCFLFKGAREGAAERAAADPRCELGEFGRGSVIYDVDDFRRDLGLLLEGEVEVVKPSPDGGGIVMTSLRPECLFGAAAVFGGEKEYVTRLTARTPCRALFFPQELLLDAMRGDFRLAENYIEFLSGRVRFLNGKIGGLIYQSAGGALSHWLYENAAPCGGTYYVNPGVSMTELARMLNMGRASLYRSLDALERGGLIRRDGRRIEVPDPEKLTEHD